ncbi:MAG: hypothetical protein WD278_20515 [Pirellulales bacterium]
MSTFRWLPIMACLALCPLSSPAEGPAKPGRSIAKEPAYKSGKPQYCLLAFGPEERTRVWLVIDGDGLYVDRNGNGDLTEKGERVACGKPIKARDPKGPVSETRPYDAGDITDSEGRVRYKGLRVLQFIANKDFVPQTAEEKALKALQQKNGYAAYANVRVTLEGKGVQDGSAEFSSSLQKVPALHFDGALAMNLLIDRSALMCGEREGTLAASIVVSGPRTDPRVSLNHDKIPAKCHPVAEIEFPSKEPGGKSVAVKVVLEHRC